MFLIRQYPKLLLLCTSMVAAYLLYFLGGLHWLHAVQGTGGYIALFFGGILFTFGFTAPFGVGVFLELGHTVNPFLGAVVGGIGALLGDLLIFEVMQFELFHEEVHKLKSLRLLRWLRGVLHHESFPQKLRIYLLWSFAGIIIASPLPDEFGVTLVSSLTTIHPRTFSLISFVANSAGIFLFLGGSRLFAG